MTQTNILVVEDRADWQDIVCSTILAEGYGAKAVFSYEEAMKAMQENKFDMAIIDPVLDIENRFNRDGLGVLQKISEAQPKTPIVVITGSLTHDIKTSLEHLCPGAPVLFKESWNALEFVSLMHQLMGEQGEAKNQSPKMDAFQKTASASTLLDSTINYPRVLLVENNDSWQEIVAGVLGETGYFWRIARSAQEALQELEKESFHVVVLDLKLQQNSLPLRSNEGWLLLDHFVETYPKVKIIVLSGRATPNDVAYLLTHYPVVRFIEKQHFTAQALQEALAQATQVPELRIQTFGQFRLWRNGHALEMWEVPEAETVIKLLLTRRVRDGRAVAADELMARLWPNSDESSGRKKLLPIINVARHTLEPDVEPKDSNFILRSANGYLFYLHERVNWDVMAFREHLKIGQQLAQEERWAEATVKLEIGQSMYRGDFLTADRAIDWANDVRREIAAEFCNLMVELADAYAAQGQYTQAIKACETTLRKDPLLEKVYRRLMHFYYCQGDKAQALKVYRNCIKLFEELFGESPTPATRQLYQAISNNEPIDCHGIS